MKRKVHPLDRVEWRDPATMQANDYNPNRVASPEMSLLKESILSNGWTQPVVVRALDDHDEPQDEAITHVIVDGFHRWSLAKGDGEVRAVSGGLVPTVLLSVDEVERRLATVRHNRARGAHGVLRMGTIVSQLQSAGVTPDEICRRLGMHREELDRLMDTRTAADVNAGDEYSEGWIAKKPKRRS